MKGLTIFLFTVACATIAMGQIKPVEEFLSKNHDLRKYYVYQSTLRVLNQNQDPNFDKLIKDVKKINAYVSQGGEVSDESFKTMLNGLSDDKFDVLVDARYEGAIIKAYGKGEGAKAYYVITAKQDADFALLEIDGQLDMSYIGALSKIDITRLSDILSDQKEN